MQRVEGKKSRALSVEELTALAATYERRLIDLGCGDGRFVLRQARADEQCLCIGIDANADALRESARRAAAKPAKGGASNALYIVSSLEALPEDLVCLATRLTVFYPWGSLLRVLALPEVGLLTKIARLAVPGAAFAVSINQSVFEDPDYVVRLDLPDLNEDRVRDELLPLWAKAGLSIDHVATEDEGAIAQSSWGKRLVKGSQRKTLTITGTVAGSASGSC